MKISKVLTHCLTAPVGVPYRNCCSAWIRKREATLFEVRADDGLVGWGEGDGVPALEEIETHVIGGDPFDHEEIYRGLSKSGRHASSASGIEMALWDLMGKALDKPACELLGGARRTQVPAYASGFFVREGMDHLEDVAEVACHCRDQGFEAVKLRTGFGPDQDQRITAAARNALGPDVKIAVDATAGYDVAASINAGRRLAAYDLLWYEEPVSAQDVDGYLAIRQALSVPIAGAESLSCESSFEHIVQQQAVDIIQPDIGRVGGFSGVGAIDALAIASKVQVIPHAFGSAIRLAATLQWLATIPDEALNRLPAYLEVDVMENALRTDLTSTPFQLEGGFVRVPDLPGLGIELDEHALRRYISGQTLVVG